MTCQLIDKDGKRSHGTQYVGVVYSDANGNADETLRFTRWEDWVEWHDKREKQMQGVLPCSIGKFVRDQLAPLQERIAQLEQTLTEKSRRTAANNQRNFDANDRRAK